jgi:hypothetical protein
MRRLPEYFSGTRSQKGWEFELVAADGPYAVYKKTSESNVYYETIIIRIQKAKVAHYPDGRVVEYPDQEVYPRDEDFGLYGWTYSTFDAAYEKMVDLVNNDVTA